MDPEAPISLSVKWAVRLLKTMDKLEGSMRNKNCRPKARELEIFSRRIIKKWMLKETHFQLMISMEVSREINMVPK